MSVTLCGPHRDDKIVFLVTQGSNTAARALVHMHSYVSSVYLFTHYNLEFTDGPLVPGAAVQNDPK